MTTPGSANSNFEQRLLRVEARQQLTELVSRYCTATDDRDYDALSRLFTADARFNSIQGAPAILAYFRKQHATMGPCYHYSHAHHFDFESDHAATGVINSHAEVSYQGQAIWMGLRYLDRYARVDGRWLIQARNNKIRYAMPLADLPKFYAGTLRYRWPGLPPKAADIPDSVDTYRASIAAREPGPAGN